MLCGSARGIPAARLRNRSRYSRGFRARRPDNRRCGQRRSEVVLGGAGCLGLICAVGISDKVLKRFDIAHVFGGAPQFKRNVSTHGTVGKPSASEKSHLFRHLGMRRTVRDTVNARHRHDLAGKKFLSHCANLFVSCENSFRQPPFPISVAGIETGTPFPRCPLQFDFTLRTVV